MPAKIPPTIPPRIPPFTERTPATTPATIPTSSNPETCLAATTATIIGNAPINISNNGPIDGLRAGILPIARIKAIAINPGSELIIILRRLIRFQILLVSASVVFPITGEYLVFHSLAKAEM